MRKGLPLVVPLALSVTGCTKAVEITDPATPVSTPVTEFNVKFAPYFAPGTFTAELDGQDVTSGFAPAAAKGGTARLRLPDIEEGLSGGLWLSTSVPPSGGAVGTLPPDIRYSGGVGGPIPSGGPGSGGSSDPRPNITMFVHKLTVSGQCSGMICETTDERYFFLLHLVPIPTTALTLRIGQSADIRLETYPANSVPIDVRVLPSSVSVRLDGAAAGVPITVTIPTKGQSRLFRVTGMVSGKLLLFLDAPGTQRGTISGLVNP